MRKFKRLLHSRYLDKPMNIALFMTCIIIVCVQVYFLFDIWIKSYINRIYVFVSSNALVLVIIPAVIPIFPYFISYFRQRIRKNDNNLNKKNKQTMKSLNKTEVFPGAITHKMIKKKEVRLVSKRSLKKMDKPMILDRKHQCNKIISCIKKLKRKQKKGKLKCLYLTGTSGAGKSVLLKSFLKNKLNKKNKSRWRCLYYNSYNTDVDLIYKEIINKNARIVIMDQFETTIQYTDIYKIIKNLICKNEIVFVFSFPQNFYDKIHKNISDYILKEKNMKKDMKYKSETYFLQYDKHDINQLKILVNTFLKVGMGTVEECLDYCEDTFRNSGKFMSVLRSERYPESLVFLCSILARIKMGELPLVEFSVISYIYEIYKDEIDYNIDKYIDDLDKIFALYLDKWTDKFPNNETGKIILQLICDGRQYNFDDLKCVTFEPKELFYYNEQTKFNIKRALEDNQFIIVKEKAFGFRDGVSTVHDYIAEKMNGYCFENLNNEIRQNVEFYKKKMVQTNQGSSMQAESAEKLIILKRYEKFTKKFSRLFVDLLVYFLMITSIIVSSVKGIRYTNNHENIYYIFIAISCYFATFYMYNVVVEFLIILQKRYYYPVTVCGVVLMVFCYVFPDYWGIFTGLEIVILGISLCAIGGITTGMAKTFFIKNKGVIYIVLGAFVIGLALLYVYTDNFGLRIALSVFFVFYALMSDVTHITYRYIINKVGMGNTISKDMW